MKAKKRISAKFRGSDDTDHPGDDRPVVITAQSSQSSILAFALWFVITGTLAALGHLACHPLRIDRLPSPDDHLNPFLAAAGLPASSRPGSLSPRSLI